MKTQIEQLVIWEEMKRRERERQHRDERPWAEPSPPPDWRPEEKKGERGVTTWQM